MAGTKNGGQIRASNGAISLFLIFLSLDFLGSNYLYVFKYKKGGELK